MRILFRYNRLSLFFTVTLGIMSTVIWVYFAKIIEATIDITENGDISQLLSMAFFSVGYILITRFLNFLFELMKIHSSNDYCERLRLDIIRNQLSKKQIIDTGGIISDVNNDAKIITENYYITFIQIITSIISFTLSTYLLLMLSWEVTIALYLISIIVMSIPYLFKRKLRESNIKLVNDLSIMNSRLKDYFSGFTILKNYGVEGRVIKELNSDLNRVNKSKSSFESNNQTVVSISHFFITLIGTIGFLFGAYFVMQGRFYYGSMVAIVQLTNTLVSPINVISSNLSKFISSQSILKKINYLLNSNYSKEQNENNPRNHEIDKIIVNGLLIRYGKKKVIDSIDYTFERGKKYILFGETGVGKSTLARALINQKEIVQGEIKYISKNVEIEFSKVKDKIKVVEQSPWIFNMSILDNIAFYKDIDKRKVEKLLNNLSFSKDFISTRVDEIMGENGQRLSQGEKQRISIARALYSDASFLILDEMNASMDVETALLIEKSILDIPNIGIINICHHANYELLDKYDYRLELKDGKIYDVSS